ncbi:hypothetical protein [Legionella anisa]|uniref:hypothetical protein n=1 Tax=Legionella anisa TaxID=28082 RepID=UPI0013EFA8A8|nr:hypothetical protein [Legionella anisa]
MTIDIHKSSRLMSKMPFTSKGGRTIEMSFTSNTAKKFGVNFLQRIKTPKGLGTVIGEAGNNLWVWIDGDTGPTYWDDIQDNVFSKNGFERVHRSSDNSYPDNVTKYIENLFKCSLSELITFFQSGPMSPIYIGKSISAIEDAEKNWEGWLGYATLYMDSLYTLYHKYIQEHSHKPLDIMQRYGELSARVTSIPKIEIRDFNIPSLKNQIKEIQEQLIDLQQKKSALLEKVTTKQDQIQIEEMFKNLEQLLNDRLNKLKELEEQNNQQRNLTYGLKQVLANRQFAEFDLHNKMVEFTVNTLFGIKPKLDDKPFMKTYKAMLTEVAEYLYEQDFSEKQTEASDKTGKDEVEDHSLDDSFTGLVLAMIGGDSSIKKAYYFRMINRLENKNTQIKEMPQSFDLETWAASNPHKMVNLYRYLFNNPKFKQFPKDLSYNDYPLFAFEIIKLEMSFILALSEVQKNDSKFSIPQEMKFHAEKMVDLLVELILDGNEETAFWTEKLIKDNKNPFIQNYRVYSALAEFYATPPHVDEEKGLFYWNKGKEITQDDAEPNQQSKLINTVHTAIHGSTEIIRRSAVETLKKAHQYHYLKLASYKNSDAALLCLEHCLQNNKLDEAKQYIDLARKADPAKAAYLEAMIVSREDGDFIPHLLKAIEFGHPDAGLFLEQEIERSMQNDTMDVFKDKYLNLLHKQFVLNALPLKIIIKMIKTAYSSNEEDQQREEFVEKWMYNLLVTTKNSDMEKKTDLTVTLILDNPYLLSDEGLLLAMSILSKERFFDKKYNPLLLYAIAQIITEQDSKGPKHFFNLAIYDFLKMNTKLVVLLMNDPPSKEKLSQCKNFTDFIKNEQITIEETSKEKSESSLTSLGIFGNNNNLPEENNSSKDPSQSTIGTKKG